MSKLNAKITTNASNMSTLWVKKWRGVKIIFENVIELLVWLKLTLRITSSMKTLKIEIEQM